MAQPNLGSLFNSLQALARDLPLTFNRIMQNITTLCTQLDNRIQGVAAHIMMIANRLSASESRDIKRDELVQAISHQLDRIEAR